MDENNFTEELHQWCQANKNNKLHNEDVEQKYYDKILDRKTNNKGTNVKSIKSVHKLVQYYIAAKMLGCNNLQHQIASYVHELIGAYYFEDIFEEVTFETPEIKSIKNPKLVYDQGVIYMIDENRTIIELICEDDTVLYRATQYKISVDSNCWKNFEYSRKAPLGMPGVNISVLWIVCAGNVFLDKVTNQYKIKDVKLAADYKIDGYDLVARYSGLHNSAWVCTEPFSNYSRGEHFLNAEWNKDHDPVTRGNIYIFRGSSEVAHVKGDWDGYYNNLSFEKLIELLEKTV